jgi:LacI family transcriptional regulator
MKNRVTLADIAVRAGVHKTTVSMALRNHRNLPKHTIERIQELAVEMGYRPDPALAALNAYRRGKMEVGEFGTFAYITNWNSADGWQMHSAHRQFFEGASDAAGRLGYEVEHFWMGDAEVSQERLAQILFHRGIEGLIFASWLPQHDAELAFDWEQFCGVKIDYFPSKTRLHSITNDQQSLIQLAFEALFRLGYQRIGLVIPTLWDTYVRNAWSIGFLAAQQEIPVEQRVPMLRYDAGSRYGVQDLDLRVPKGMLAAWLEAHEPDVVLSYYPYVDASFRELGLGTGSNICYADLFLEDLSGGMAGVVNRCREVGEAAVEQLVGQVQRHTYGQLEFESRTLVEGYWKGGHSLRRWDKAACPVQSPSGFCTDARGLAGTLSDASALGADGS